jgi:hypothetical protein
MNLDIRQVNLFLIKLVPLQYNASCSLLNGISCLIIKDKSFIILDMMNIFDKVAIYLLEFVVLLIQH